MSDLIRREDVKIPIERLREIVHHHYGTLAIDLQTLDLIQDIIIAARETPETIATDDVIAYSCPECKSVSILYDPANEQHCPVCGIRRK